MTNCIKKIRRNLIITFLFLAHIFANISQITIILHSDVQNTVLAEDYSKICLIFFWYGTEPCSLKEWYLEEINCHKIKIYCI